MRKPVLVLCVLALTAGCGDSGTPTSNDDDVVGGGSHSVAGVVQDSVAGVGVPNVVVRIGQSMATTDFLGSYSLNAPSGTHTVTVTDPRYEAFNTSITLAANTTLNLPLRRLAPFLRGFTTNGNATELTATIVDIQGAQTVDLGNGSSVLVEGPGFVSLIFAGPWLRTQINATSWLVTVGVVNAGAQKATWSIRDNSGNAATFECFVGSTCSETHP